MLDTNDYILFKRLYTIYWSLMPMEQEELTLPKFNQSIWTDAIEVVIITMIVLIPTIFYPRVIDIFHPIKTLTFSLLVIIGLTLWGFNVLKKEEFKIISNPLNIPVLSFIIICVLSLIWSDSPFISLKELPLFLAGPLLYFIIVNNIYNERQINRIIGSVLIVGALFGIYGILQYNGIDFSFWIGNYGRGKVFGLFGNAGYFAGYLMFPLPIAIALFFVCNNKIKKILLLIAILAMSGALLATLTRGSYVALGISLSSMFLLFLSSYGSFFDKEKKKREEISSDKKQKKAAAKDTDTNYRYKPLLYLSIIVLAIILRITIA